MHSFFARCMARWFGDLGRVDRDGGRGQRRVTLPAVAASLSSPYSNANYGPSALRQGVTVAIVDA